MLQKEENEENGEGIKQKKAEDEGRVLEKEEKKNMIRKKKKKKEKGTKKENALQFLNVTNQLKKYRQMFAVCFCFMLLLPEFTACVNRHHPLF